MRRRPTRPNLRSRENELAVSPPAGYSTVVHTDGTRIEPCALAAVEELDDTMFSALAGDASALDSASTRWRKLGRSLPRPLLDQARSEYLDRATDAWDSYREGESGDVVRAFAALDVMLMLESNE